MARFLTTALVLALLGLSGELSLAAEDAKLREVSAEAWAASVSRRFLSKSTAPAAGESLIRRALADVHRQSSPAQRGFFARLLPEAMELMWRKNIPVAATAAMAAYESGYGSSALARIHNNYFGIKAFADWTGPRARNMPTRDLGVLTRADFRSYGSLRESTQNYGEFLTTKSRYQAALRATTGPEFVARVLAGGYCPDRDYHANAVAIMNRHRLLHLERACRSAFALSDFADDGW